MRPMRNLMLMPATAGLIGCSGSGIRVNSDYDETADFGPYRTYAWMIRPADDVLDRQIRSAIEAELLFETVLPQ